MTPVRGVRSRMHFALKDGKSKLGSGGRNKEEGATHSRSLD